MACNQKQIKKFPWTQERIASLWNAMKEHVAAGNTRAEILSKLSGETGLTPETIQNGLNRGARGGGVKHLTDEVWMRQRDVRIADQMARQMVTEMNTPDWVKKADYLQNLPRRVAVKWHFTVFPKTHFGDQLVTDSKVHFTLMGRSYALATKAGKLAHEQRMAEMKADTLTNTGGLRAGLRAGLDIEAGGGHGAAFRGARKQMLGTAKETKSAMAFDELRYSRAQMWKTLWNKMDSTEQADLPGLKIMAEVLNNKTGSGRLTSTFGRQVANWLFAPRLKPAQIRSAFRDPYRAIKALTVSKAQATPAELFASRYVIRKMGRLAAAQTAIMAAEVAYAASTGDKENAPNIGRDWDSINRSDWMEPKIMGYAIPLLPTVQLLRIPFQIISAIHSARAGESSVGKGLERGTRTVLGWANPAVSLALEVIGGQQGGTGRPTPFPGFFHTTKETATRRAMTTTEYLGTKMPIWMANISRELYDEMRGHGVSHPQASDWIKSLTVGALTGPTGYHAKAPRDIPTERVQSRLEDSPFYNRMSEDLKEKYKQRLLRREYKRFKAEEKLKPIPSIF